MRSPFFVLALLAAACCTPSHDAPSAQTQPPPAPPLLAETTPATAAEIARGKQLVQMACVSCHAIEADASSPHPDAAPLARLSENYPVALLDEAFAEGIMVGHPDMPEFKLLPEDVRALIGYLESIQANRAI